MATLIVVYNDGSQTSERTFENAWEVLHQGSEEMPDVMSLSDTEIVARVGELVGRMTGQYTVTRPNTGNILVSPKAVFGS